MHVAFRLILRAMRRLRLPDFEVAFCPDDCPPAMNAKPGHVLPALTTINVDVLNFVGGFFLVEALGCETIAFPSLTSVGGSFAVLENRLLEECSLPLLGGISGDIDVLDNPCTSIHFPMLHAVI